MVPTARLELARLSSLPPQDSVSTNFTTSAWRGAEAPPKTRYFGMAPDLSAGAAGAGAGVGATGWAGIASGLLDSCFWLEK